MNAIRIVGIVLLVLGGIGLAYGGFSYTKDTHTANLGPVQLSVQEKERFNIPVWAGVGFMVLGGVLLFAGGRKA